MYTAIFGQYEELKEPLVITPGWRYICYTDQPFESKVWEIRTGYNEMTAIRYCRHLKILGFSFYEKSIWIDGSFQINCDLNEFWANKFTSPMTVIQHPMRNCVYEEAATCQRNGRGDVNDIARQIGKYSNEGLPFNNGLIQSGIIMRENTAQVRQFCDLWWDQINLSTRDQIGFAYAEWKMGIKWPRIQMDYRTSNDFIFKTHYHRRKKV